MANNTQVKFFSSDMPAAGQISGVETGTSTLTTVKKVLKACLVDGFQKTQVISGTITDNVCVLQIADGKTFGLHSVIKLSGISNYTDMNTEHRVLGSISNTITIAVDEDNGTLSGANIEIEYAAAGWEIPAATSSSEILLRSANPLSTKVVLRVVEADYKWLEINAYRNVISGSPSGQTPAPAQGGKLYMGKSASNDDTPRDWYLIASDKFIYFFIKPSVAAGDNAGGFSHLAFGDFIWGLPSGAGKGFNSILIAINDNSDLKYPYNDCLGRNNWNTSSCMYVLKDNIYGFSGASTTIAYNIPHRNELSCNSGPNYPDIRSNGISMIPYNVVNNVFQVLGKLPGMYMVNHDMQGSFVNSSILTSPDNSKCFIGLYTVYNTTNILLSQNPHNANSGAPLFDIYGPWE